MINTPKIYKIRVTFTVDHATDHKRIVSALRNRVLRSGLPFEPAKVNPKWPRLAYGPVLGQGQRSEGEIADLYFSVPVSPEEVRAKLNASASGGMRILRVQRVPYALPSVSHLAEVMKYRVQGDFASYTPAVGAETFFRGKQVYVIMQAPNGMTVQQDLKPFVLSVAQPQPDQLELWLQKSADKMAKPEEVVAAWLQVPVPTETVFALPGIEFIREALYWRDSSENLHAI